MSSEALPTESLAGNWRGWLTENMLRGVPPAALCQLLAGAGVGAEDCQQELAAIAADPIYQGALRAARVARRADFLARTRRLLATTSPAPLVERRSGLTAEAFYRDYYALHRPVILTDLQDSWVARKSWSPEAFKARFGAVEVSVQEGRRGGVDEAYAPAELVRTTTMGAFAERVMAAGTDTNAFYMVATCNNLASPALRPLLDELVPLPPMISPTLEPETYYMWFGPGGTVTPLHHDQASILHCLITGRKRFWLIAPDEVAVFAGSRGLFGNFDCEAIDLAARPELATVAIHEVELEAGEALFLPVAWWHQVRTLTPSIAVTFNGFTQTNDFAGGFDTLNDAPL